MLYTKLFFFFLIEITFAQSFKFIAMSDSRGSNNGVNEKVLSTFVSHIIKKQKDAKFVTFMGDLVDGSKTNPQSTVEQLKFWKKVMTPIYENPNMIWPKVWVVVGNHEVQHRDDEKNFRSLFPNVFLNGPDDEKGITYSFDYNNCHFVFVTSDRWYYGNIADTTDDKRDWHYIKNLDWLENDLREANKRNVNWSFVFSHEGAFPIGGHLRDCLSFLGLNLKLPLDSTREWYLNQRNKFWKILKENKVAAYIVGHEHIYGRQIIDSVYQIVAGSSGAPLYYLNPKFGDNPEKKRYGQEFTYNEAIPYYQALNYFYKEGENCQAAKNFVGFRAFNYCSFDVKKNKITVTTFGAFPKDDAKPFELGTEIKIIDKFVIKKR